MRRIATVGSVLLTVLVCAATLTPAASAAQRPGTVAMAPASPAAEPVREIIVVRDRGVSAAGRADIRSDAGVVYVRSLPLTRAELVRAPKGELAAALKTLNADPDVRYAEADSVVHGQSSDPYWTSMWGAENTGQTINGWPGVADADIDVPEAWASSTGVGVRVGVIDSGLDFAQPDLLGQVALNPGESGDGKETNGVDDDANGFVDDVRGWDFSAGDDDPSDEHGHGTHLSGIIAARADNDIGVAGVAPDAQVVPLRGLDDRLSGQISGIVEALDYAADTGLVAVNASFSGGFSRSEQDAIAAHPDLLVIAAAGNGGYDGVGDDVDANPVYPCSFDEPNVICVGASDNRDRPSTFSNFAAVSVDLFAPGADIMSAWMEGGHVDCGFSCFRFASGTSMAAPQVTGAVALINAADPSLSAAQIKAKLVGSAEPKPALAGRSVSGGRLNVAYAVASATSDSDADDDGVDAAQDNCPSAANSSQLDADGDHIGDACDADDDGDGTSDSSDNCPMMANANQADADSDGVGDVCDPTPRGPDNDHDSVPALDDNCPTVGNADQADADSDGVGDACDATPRGVDDDEDGVPAMDDNCLTVANADQLDTDWDSAGDECDPDDDNDGELDGSDNCRLLYNADQANSDDASDGGDACDADDDNDGKADDHDNCQLIVNATQANHDSDVLGDACDPDDDNDGKADGTDNCPLQANPGQSNADGDSLGDACDPTPGLTPPLGETPQPADPTPPVPVAPIVTPPVVGLRAPVLSAAKLSRGKLSRKHSLTVRFDLDRAARTRLSVLRRSGGRYRKLKSVSITGRKAHNRFSLRVKFGHFRLRPGRYRLTVRATDGTLHSKTRSVSFTVR